MAAMLVIGASGQAVAAAMDAKQTQIAAKALGFVTPKPAAGARVVVLAGAADPAAVQAALSGFAVVAGGPADAAGAFAVFVPSAAEAKAVAGKGVVTVSGDPACVDAGACVIAIETQPKVSIYVSKAAAAAAGIEFDANFKMMITEK